MDSNVSIEVSGGILTATISRPDRKNALTNEMYGALADCIEQGSANKQIRVLLLKAEGELFTAGNDLGDFVQYSNGNFPDERHVHRFLRALAITTLPIVAAVQGKAVGVGTTMLLHCDYVLMSDDAQLMTPFVNLALVPEAASSLLLPLRIGHSRAFEMFALGEPVPASTALAWGLANKICSQEDLQAEARHMAELMASKPAGSLSLTKALMRDATTLAALIDRENSLFDQRLVSAEAKEAFAAFAEKRKPDFSNIA